LAKNRQSNCGELACRHRSPAGRSLPRTKTSTTSSTRS
jgi:hypothetical protein